MTAPDSEKKSILTTSPFSSRKTRWQTRREDCQENVYEEVTAVDRPPHRVTVGEYVGLCLLIEFPDVPGIISRTEVEQFCNGQRYDSFDNNGSVYNYFLDNSDGKLHYKNIVTPYYTAQHNREYYRDECEEFGIRTEELIREALDYLVTQSFDFSSLTADSDGYIFATNVFYAGEIVNYFDKGLWPHSSTLKSEYTLPDDRFICDYQITNMGNELTLGTFCHETGHLLCDFPDLYDYGDDGFKSSGIGDYCLMCTGNLANEKNPTQVNAYLKYLAGWASRTVDIKPGSQKIRSDTNEFFIHRNKENPREYFIIENRQKRGRDEFLPGSGLAIWHIDECGNNENQHRSSDLHFECSLEQADGKFDLERGKELPGDEWDLYHADGNTQFDDLTTPNSRWWDGTISGLELSNISASGPIMTFEAKI